MVKIKLQRVGTKNQPKYRVVIQEAREKLGGKVVAILGNYNPRQTPTLFEVNKDALESWLKKGAQPTEKVRILLGKAGLMPALDLSQKTKRKPKKEAKAEGAPKEAEKPAPAPAEAPKEVEKA